MAGEGGGERRRRRARGGGRPGRTLPACTVSADEPEVRGDRKRMPERDIVVADGVIQRMFLNKV